jgi:glycosyltransferase involved in cell wall biosynthesis
MNKKPKVLLIGSTVNPVHIKSYYNLMREMCSDILIIGSHKVDFAPCETVSFSLKNPIGIIETIKKIRKIAADFQPDIIHVHQANSIGFLVSLANRNKYKQVLTTWGDDVLIFPQKNVFFKALTFTSLKYSDEITADAQIMADSIYSFFGNKKKVVIANFGIEWDENLIRLPKEKIIYSNRLHDSLYNIDLIIKGSAEFLKNHPDWKLVVAARGSLTEELKKIAQESIASNQVEFLGFLKPDDNQNWYLQSSIYVSIPDTDGTSISLLEAMGYGCIPVVSDLPANKEWIEDGKNGIIVSNRAELNKSLEEALQLDADFVKNENEKIILKKATKEANRTIFNQIYQRLLS